MESNIETNLKTFKEIIEENPATSHIYMRTDDGRLVDIPVRDAEFNIRNHADWVVEGGAVPQIELAVTQKEHQEEELPILPPKPSEEPSLVKDEEDTLQEPQVHDNDEMTALPKKTVQEAVKSMQESPKSTQMKPKSKAKSIHAKKPATRKPKRKA